MTVTTTRSTGIRFENIDKQFGHFYALKRLSLEIAPGEMTVLAGRNGSGKTTLLRIAAGLVRPTRGNVRVYANDHSGSGTNESANACRPGFVGHATMAYDELTARENLLLFSRLLKITESLRRVDELLGEVGLHERRDSLVRTFSRGMRQRVAIARALLQTPKILLLDEPSTGLDPQGIQWLTNTLQRLRNDGCTILVSLHGESDISSLASRAVRLEAGQIAADTRLGGTLQSVLRFAGA